MTVGCTPYVYSQSVQQSSGNGTKEDIEALLQGYGSVLDCPAAMYSAELYSVYPDAKYILVSLASIYIRNQC